MGNFFKKIGTGALVIILSPFGLVAFVLFAIYSVLKLIFLWFKAIGKFFVGEKLTDPLDIERQAAQIFEKEQLEKKKSVEKTADGKFAGATIHIYGTPTPQEAVTPSPKLDVIDEPITPKSIETAKVKNEDPLAVLLEVEKDD